jgi:hypothetical protein
LGGPGLAPPARGGQRAIGADAGSLTVDFLAVSTEGKPIADLKAEQLALKIDGKPRTVQSLRFVKLSDGTPAAAGSTTPFDSPAPAPFGTNTADPGRALMLVIDDESMLPGNERQLTTALGPFIAGLAPSDRVGLVTMPKALIKVEATTSKGAVADAVKKVSGHKPVSGQDTTCHTRETLDALTGLLGSMGEHTTVLFFSSGLVSTKGSGSDCDITNVDFQNVATAAYGAGVRMYVILPESDPASRAGMESLAGSLNTPLLNLAVGIGGNALERIANETSAYYIVSFDADATERDGKSHRVDLKVTAENVTVRAPGAITISKTDPKASKPSPKDMIKAPRGTTYRDLPLRVAGYVSRGDAQKVQVLIAVESTDPAARLASETAVLIDPTGKANQVSAADKDLGKSSLMQSILIVPGKYRLRVAATDASGRAGMADIDLTAELTSAGPMSLSGIVLGLKGASGFVPKMQFSDEPEVTALFQIYGANPGKEISTMVEIAATTDGPALITAGPEITMSGADTFAAITALPIAKLAPGDYVVRATFTVQGEAPGKVFRTLRKVK